ncbi:hypothetical protein BDQ12DRAFT_152220 [Crucibulum laeve]|uniref:RanBP2-type domain-containing protein n=1 Tax=Crucibulum laeve TaxID=68775 RepID=A0A5C3M0K8_9AGAR|nr:hypothetical protein BDQ12DRAFT_152220 [Crucibulum laeve]
MNSSRPPPLYSSTNMSSFAFADPMSAKSSSFEDAVARLQHLSFRSNSALNPQSASLQTPSPYSDASPSKVYCTLDPPFTMSYPYLTQQLDRDTSPKPHSFEHSPASSTSSDQDYASGLSSRASTSRPSHGFEAFFGTRSRVVRLFNLPTSAESFLSAVFSPQNSAEYARGSIPIPATMWELREEYSDPNCDSIWAVFKTHEEACAALTLSGPAMSVTTALESDLEPFRKLKRFVPRSMAPTPSTSTLSSRPPLDLHHPQMLRASSSYSDLHRPPSASPNHLASKNGYTISTNPPNPRTSFRLGDWICTSPKCAAHNFGRNVNCIGCGYPRIDSGMMPPQNQTSSSQAARAVPSPRFSSMQGNVTYYSSGPPTAQQQQQHHQQSQQPAPPSFSDAGSQPCFPPSGSTPQNSAPPKAAHPLLTPSGRTFAVGGRVQNISSDPLSPCIMYWPDNEPFPEQGQIRPSGLTGIPPPIMNTGNRGPISHQPGDWICKKCNYLNWRRRKVCQTCLPYAEGNGDSISAAVQAERIALLTSVLAQTQRSTIGVVPPAAPEAAAAQSLRSHSMTPPQVQRRFVDVSPPQTMRTIQRPVHRSQSHFQLGGQYATSSSQYTNATPIYQTSGHRQPSPIYSTGPSLSRAPSSPPEPVPEASHLLPSFFQDVQDQADLLHSPSLSPTATTASSTDLSLEDYDSLVASTAMLGLGPAIQTASSTISSTDNIWKLDGDESKSLSAFPLPNQDELLGGSRKTSREQLRAQDTGAFNSIYNIRN